MDRSLDAFFSDTDYVVPLPSGDTAVVNVGAMHADIDAWVTDYGLSSWCFVTAWNPSATERDRRENARANVALFMDLQGDGHPAVGATARPRSGEWPVEPGFVVLGVSRDQALDYAKRYGQLAVVFADVGGEAHLLWVEG